MIIALATVSGFQNGIKDKITGLNGDIVIDDISNVEGSVPVPMSIYSEYLKDRINSVPGVNRVSTCLVRPFIAKGEVEIEGMLAKGVDAGTDLTFFSQHLLEGKLPDFSRDTNTVLISKTTADRLGLKLGNRLRMIFFKQDEEGNSRVKALNPVITGIYSTGMEEFDKSLAVMHRGMLRRVVYPPQSYTHWELDIDDYKKAPDIAYAIQQVLPAGKFNVNTADRYNRQLFDWLGLLDTNVVIIIVLMLLVACINMSTTLLILITERAKMVGLLKALGANNKGIRRIFLYQAVFIATAGLFFGNLIGLLFCWLQYKFEIIQLNVETYYVNHVLIDIEFWHLPAVNFGTLLICLAVLLIPSGIVTRISPIKTLKFE